MGYLTTTRLRFAADPPAGWDRRFIFNDDEDLALIQAKSAVETEQHSRQLEDDFAASQATEAEGQARVERTRTFAAEALLNLVKLQFKPYNDGVSKAGVQHLALPLSPLLLLKGFYATTRGPYEDFYHNFFPALKAYQARNQGESSWLMGKIRGVIDKPPSFDFSQLDVSLEQLAEVFPKEQENDLLHVIQDLVSIGLLAPALQKPNAYCLTPLAWLLYDEVLFQEVSNLHAKAAKIENPAEAKAQMMDDVKRLLSNHHWMHVPDQDAVSLLTSIGASVDRSLLYQSSLPFSPITLPKDTPPLFHPDSALASLKKIDEQTDEADLEYEQGRPGDYSITHWHKNNMRCVADCGTGHGEVAQSGNNSLFYVTGATGPRQVEQSGDGSRFYTQASTGRSFIWQQGNRSQFMTEIDPKDAICVSGKGSSFQLINSGPFRLVLEGSPRDWEFHYTLIEGQGDDSPAQLVGILDNTKTKSRVCILHLLDFLEKPDIQYTSTPEEIRGKFNTEYEQAIKKHEAPDGFDNWVNL